MSRLSCIWKRVEKWAIYLTIIVFVASRLIGLFVPDISHYFNDGGSLIVIGILLLLVFRFIDERLPEHGQGKAITHLPFREISENICKDRPIQERVDIFAHTSAMYYRYLHDSNLHIKRLRILVCDPNSVSQFPSPASEKDKENLKQIINQTMESWLRFKGEGRIDSIEIRTFCFMPTFHFMVVDGRVSHFGLLSLREDWTGLRVLESYMIDEEVFPGRQMISDFEQFYETILSKYSQPYIS